MSGELASMVHTSTPELTLHQDTINQNRLPSGLLTLSPGSVPSNGCHFVFDVGDAFDKIDTPELDLSCDTTSVIRLVSDCSSFLEVRSYYSEPYSCDPHVLYSGDAPNNLNIDFENSIDTLTMENTSRTPDLAAILEGSDVGLVVQYPLVLVIDKYVLSDCVLDTALVNLVVFLEILIFEFIFTVVLQKPLWELMMLGDSGCWFWWLLIYLMYSLHRCI